MKSKNSIKIVYLLLFLMLGNYASGQSWEIFLKKAEKNYNLGLYKKALKENKKLHKKIPKKYANDQKLVAWNTIHKARTLEAMGLFTDVEIEINNALNILETTKSSEFDGYAIGILRITDIYSKIGYFASADTLLTNLQTELEEQGKEATTLFYEAQFRKARVYMNIGRLNEARKMLTELLPVWEKSIKQNDGLTGLTKLDIAYRKRLLARMLTLEGEILTNKGEYEKADSVLMANSKKITSNAGKNNFTYINYFIAVGQNYFDQENYKKADKYFNKALASTRSTGKPYLTVLERLINIDVFTEKEGQYKEKMERWKRITKTSFKKGKYYDIRQDFLRGEQLRIQKAYAAAEKKFIKILNTSPDILPEFHPLRATINDHLYDLGTRKDQRVEAAGSRLQEIVKIKKYLLGDKSPIYQFQRIQLAHYYLNYSNNFNKARAIFSSNPHKVVMAEMSTTHKNYIPLLNYTANYFDIVEDFTQAQKLLQESVDILEREKGDKAIETARALILLANIKVTTGNYLAAEEHTNQAISIFRKKLKKNDPEYADALTSAARIYGIMGDYDKAQDLALYSRKRFKKGGFKDISEIGEAVEALAFLNIKMGQYSETESLLLKIIKNKEKKYGADSRKLLVPLNALANLYTILGDYKPAEQYVQRSAQISKKVFGKTSIKYAESLTLVANLYKELGSYNKAEDAARSAIKITIDKLGKDHIQLANAYRELAIIRFLKGNGKNVAEVEKLLLDARKIILVNFDDTHPMYAEIIKDLARLYIETKKYDKALEYLLKADEIWTEVLGKKSRSSAEVAMLLGHFYNQTKKFIKAQEYFEKAEKIYAKIFDKEHPEYVNTLSKLAQMQYISGNPAEATKTLNQTTDTYLNFIKNHFSSLSEREKTKFWNKNKFDFEFFNTLAVNQARTNPSLVEKMYNNILKTKALLLNGSIKVRQSILNSGNIDLVVLFKDWMDKKEQLTGILAMNSDQLEANGINKQDLIKEIDNIEKELSEKSEVFKNNRKRNEVTWKSVRKSLKDGEAAVEITRFRYFKDSFTNDIKYAALIITSKSKTPKLVVLSNGTKLESNYFKYYRKSIQFQFEDEYSYTQYWKPIQDAIPTDVKTVFLSPDGIYNQINVESIMVDEESYVIDKINIRLVSNTKDLIDRKKVSQKDIKETKKGWAILFGNPKFYDTKAAASSKASAIGMTEIPQLPGTEREITSINQVLKAQGWTTSMYLGNDALESTIKKAQNPKVLHIATHGFFVEHKDKDENNLNGLSTKELEESPLLRSGVLARGAGDLLATNGSNFNASDGVLTAFEAMNLNFDNTELVVLSACETGLGEVMQGEGVNGLQRAFLVAGADALIMSLFKVSDEVTEKLMTRFYENWLVYGDKRKAFNLAQKEIKEEYGSPLYWGAFNMIGAD